MTKDYTHDLNREVRSISGCYELQSEGKIEMDGREALYVIGNAVVDSSCCGTWGCCYALVPGFVVKWKYKKNDEGIPVSEVEPIIDEGPKKKLKKLLETKFGVTQVQFW